MSALSCLLMAGCASMSPSKLFSHYSLQNTPAYQSLNQGDYQRSVELQVNTEGLLSELELGRLEMLNQDIEASQTQFEEAYANVRALEEKAVITLSGSATSIGALALNDNITEYLPTDYEQGYLHLYSALNYLQQNDLEGALVEMRRANRVQERALDNRESSLERAESKLKESGVEPNLGSALSRYPDAGSTLKAVQNGYLFYLSALLFEADKDLNAAYIDIKRALAVADENRDVVDAAVRIGTKFGAREDVERIKQQYAHLLESDERELNQNLGRVIVIQETGVVSAMSEWRLTVPVYDSRNNTAFYSVALPYYVQGAPVLPTATSVDGSELLFSQLTDVNLMASQALTEQMPTILVRQLLRAITKENVRREVASGDEVGNALLNIFNTLTEQPDTRSWQSLPATVASASAMIDSGEHNIEVGAQRLTVHVDPGQTILVWISQQGNNAVMWAVNLGRI